MVDEVKHPEIIQFFPIDKTFWRAASAVVEQSRRQGNMVAQEDRKFGPEAHPRIIRTKEN